MCLEGLVDLWLGQHGVLSNERGSWGGAGRRKDRWRDDGSPDQGGGKHGCQLRGVCAGCHPGIPPLLVGFGPVGKRIKVANVGARFVQRELDFEDLGMTINGETVEVSTSTEEDIITVTAQGDPNGGEVVINWNGRSHSWSYHVPGFYRDGADPYSTPKGSITVREYHGLEGVQVRDLVRAEKFPGRADRTENAGYFEWPQSGNIGESPEGNVHDNYGVQMVGFVHPPVTARYRFYIAADDEAHLWLSTDETPANRQLIAVEPQWNGVRNFTTGERRELVDEGTDDERHVNVSKYIELEAGKAYFIEALMKEGGGGDNLAVAARIEGDGEVEDGDEPIPGGIFVTMVDITLCFRVQWNFGRVFDFPG